MNSPRPTSKSAAQILDERAERLASPPLAATAAQEQLTVLEFSVHGERYAFESALVVEFVVLSEITPLPCVPAFIAGLLNVRGRLLPAVDLRRFCNLPERGITDLHHAVIIRQGAVEIGVIADLVAGLRALDPAALQPASAALTAIEARFVKGLTADLLCVLDASALLAEPRLLVNDDPAN